jgi:hypothetical protein
LIVETWGIVRMAELTTPFPAVWLIGDANHPEFGDAVELLHATADVRRFVDAAQAVSARIDLNQNSELIVFAASRPGQLRERDVELLRRWLPLAGMVALLGSWCEGETRTGRPVPGVLRSYWYDFPNWWRRQQALRAAGGCPDWARPATVDTHELGSRVATCGGKSSAGLIVLQTTCWETADVLADVLQRAGYATVWIPPGGRAPTLRGAVAGIWEGRQLDAPEIGRLDEFCRRLAKDAAPVIALADFPRRDRCGAAQRAGAAAVLGKPWLNVDLLLTLERLTQRDDRRVAAPVVARAA